MGKQYDWIFPRPTRPRSWCRAASPKRSACSITIQVAFGTSTPTSTTLVAIKIWIVPCRKASRIRCCSDSSTREWTRPSLNCGKTFSERNSYIRSAVFKVFLRLPVSVSSSSVSSIRGYTKYAWCPQLTSFATKSYTRLSLPMRVRYVFIGLRPQGIVLMIDTSRSPNTVRASVRGIGVALIISKCGANGFLPFSIIALRCKTPKRCCSSITASWRSLYCTFFEKSACVPITRSIVPSFNPCSSGPRPSAFTLPVKNASDTPQGDKRRAAVSPCWRASSSVGASSAHCPPQSITRRQAKKAASVFPDPTSPCKRRAIVYTAVSGIGVSVCISSIPASTAARLL